uniref:Deoxyuridine 5'-triphosphate nucleotidohydrolase n=1 Tax=Tetranychus urticae TaxID=32264 RepID=T1KPD0_TETUR
MSMFYSKCYPDVSSPSRGTIDSVGYDLQSYENLVLPSRKITIVKTGIKVQPPAGCYVRLASRSGLASKGIVVHGGVIDPDYTGEIRVILHNWSDEDFTITKGMRIAQMIVERAEVPDLVEVEQLINVGERGRSGFGSTGI